MSLLIVKSLSNTLLLFVMSHKPLIYSIMDKIMTLAGPIPPINLDKKFSVHFTKPKRREKFEGYDPIIIVGGTLTSYSKKYGGESGTDELLRIEREVFNALKDGKMVCLIFEIDQLFSRIFKRLGVIFNSWPQPIVELTTHQTDFSDFIEGFGSTRYSFKGDFDKIISKTGNGEIAGFSKKIQKGNLLYLPCYISIEELGKISVLSDFLPCLLKSLSKFKLRVQYEAPKWIDDFDFTKEEPIIDEITELQNKLADKKEKLAFYSRLKEILWFRDDDLIEPIINMFKSLGLETNRDEQFKEDFWLKDNSEEIIVEVKALNKNLRGHHISQLDGHRDRRDKPQDFPALLIVNSFNNAGSLQEKDKPISPTEIKKAVKLDVLIIRTLDLCNAFSQIEDGKLTATKLFDLLKTEHGWLRITDEGYDILKS